MARVRLAAHSPDGRSTDEAYPLQPLAKVAARVNNGRVEVLGT